MGPPVSDTPNTTTAQITRPPDAQMNKRLQMHKALGTGRTIDALPSVPEPRLEPEITFGLNT